MTDDLTNFAEGDYLNFKARGNVIEGIYQGYTIEEDTFNPGQKRPIYAIEVEGKQKKLGSSSKRLANAFLDVNPEKGDFIRITRTGERFNTQFSVEKSKEAPVSATEDNKEEEMPF